MKYAIRYFVILLIAFSVGCASGYTGMTTAQKAEFYFNTLDLVLIAVESTWARYNPSGPGEDYDFAVASYNDLKRAIVIYIKQMELLGIIGDDLPDYATERIVGIESRAAELGLVPGDIE